MKNKQRGITFLGFLIVLAVVGFAAFVGMKLFPIYNEAYSVKTALKGLATEPGIADSSPEQIKDLFFRRLYINYSETVKPEHVKIERKNGVPSIRVNYEARRTLFGNLDVVGRFDFEQNLTRQGDGGN